MSLYVKIIDEPTGQVVAPLEVLKNWNGSCWDSTPEKRILVKIVEEVTDNNGVVKTEVRFTPESFRDDGYYFFPQRFPHEPLRRFMIYHPRYPKCTLRVLPGGKTLYVARSAPQQLIHQVGGNRIELQLTPHHLVPFSGRDRFVFGANLAWLDGQYDHDFGPNFLPKPTQPGQPPQPPPPYPTYLDPNHWDYQRRLGNLEAYFQHMSTVFNCRVVRVWVFEGCEGLDFINNPVSMNPAIGTSVKTILQLAEKYDLYIYWCLLTSKPPKPPNPAHPGFAKDVGIIRSASNPRSSPFLNNALRSFCGAITQGPARTFAIDVMNEPEKYVARGNVNWDQIRTYVRECCRKIKGYLGQSVLVSCGSKGTGWVNHNPPFVETMSNYVGLGLDFYDFHIYNDTGELPMSYDETL